MNRRRPLPITERIRQARLELGLSQGQVSERTGLTQTSLSRYETGAANPSEPSLRLLASIYGRKYEWFYGEEIEPTEEESIDIEDPELRLFFRGEWDELTEDEKEFLKGMIRESRELLRKRRERGEP